MDSKKIADLFSNGGKSSDSNEVNDNLRPPKTHKVEESGALRRVKAFLPLMEESNLRMESEIRTSGSTRDVCLEKNDDSDKEHEEDGKPCIELNLALGVLENKTAEKQSTEITSLRLPNGTILHNDNEGEHDTDTLIEEIPKT